MGGAHPRSVDDRNDRLAAARARLKTILIYNIYNNLLKKISSAKDMLWKARSGVTSGTNPDKWTVSDAIIKVLSAKSAILIYNVI